MRVRYCHFNSAADYSGSLSRDDTSTKSGMEVVLDVHFLEKPGSHVKIQDGGHFLRWLTF
jgi:hypothetical protein